MCPRGVLIEVGRLFTFRVGLKGLLRTSLYANACYLVADVAVVSLLGFAFWTLAARLSMTSDVNNGHETFHAASSPA